MTSGQADGTGASGWTFARPPRAVPPLAPLVGSSDSPASWLARAEGLVGDASRALTAAHSIDWVSDAATRYRAVVDEAQLTLMMTRTVVSSAHRELVRIEAARSRAADDSRGSLARALLSVTCVP